VAPRRAERRARRIVLPTQAGPDALLAPQLDRGQEQVLEESELVPIEIVERGPRGRRVVADVTHELGDVGPVLLLDVGVIVLLVGPAPRELDRLRLAVAVEMIVDELRAIVGIDPAQAKGQRPPDLVQGRFDAGFAAAEDRPGLDPGGVDVGGIEGMAKLPVRPMPRMRHQIQLGEARRRHIPVIRLQRNVVLEEGTHSAAS